jgi:hypothetical protein
VFGQKWSQNGRTLKGRSAGFGVSEAAGAEEEEEASSARTQTAAKATTAERETARIVWGGEREDRCGNSGTPAQRALYFLIYTNQYTCHNVDSAGDLAPAAIHIIQYLFSARGDLHAPTQRVPEQTHRPGTWQQIFALPVPFVAVSSTPGPAQGLAPPRVPVVAT